MNSSAVSFYFAYFITGVNCAGLHIELYITDWQYEKKYSYREEGISPGFEATHIQISAKHCHLI
jgi:hypothetical protein